ncbi:hypothetical protein [Vibrio sp. EJY3]|uniref:hypothetical protein n=1 Tax=Vibrio sp. (strain EJY3) TaxID=1116375 RepID=UPI000306F780|nr:hypothetical protein [Vibrio sp. EJY3]
MNNKDTYIELLKISIKLEAFTQSFYEEIDCLKVLVESLEPEPQKVGPNDTENIFDL